MTDKGGEKMMIHLRKALTNEVLSNLLSAQKNMASTETVNAIGLILLSRYILHFLKQLDDEVIDLCSEAEVKRCQKPVSDL